MKKIILLALPFVFAMSCIFVSHAQNGIITTIGGTGTSGFSGDGGQATAAQFTYPAGVATDASGNIYFVDYTWVRKITASGIVTTVAGNGSMTFSGDGGPATAAGLSVTSYIGSIAVDNSGNIYVADDHNRIRKINTSGIITTIAGNGTGSISGDGGPATSAAVETGPIAVDNAGNVYIAQYNNTIRKINSSGIINTIAGNGTTGFSGDGGPAIAAAFHHLSGLAFDQSGNLYIVDSGNARIRMINPSGIVNTIVGGASTSGPLGDGGLAISAAINGPTSVSIDSAGNIFILESNGARIRRINNHGIINTIVGNGTGGFSGDGSPGVFATIRAHGIAAGVNGLFIADADNYRIRKIVVGPNIFSYNLVANLNILCKGAQFSLRTSTYSSSSIKTWFGDGITDSIIVLPSGGLGYANVTHQYPASGTYAVKHVYYVSGTPTDSLQYSFEYSFCNILPINFFYDYAGTCNHSSVPLSNVPITTQIAKNGVPVDTLSATSGTSYTAYGVPGDVFSYKVLSTPPALTNVCPSTAIILDTLQTGIDTAETKYFGFSCPGTCQFDLNVNAIIPVTGIHDQWGDIYIRNLGNNPVPPTVTLHFSQKYVYTGDANPTPTSFGPGTITWTLGTLVDNTSDPVDLYYAIWDNPSTGNLPIGDTVNEYITVGPTSGDANPADNFMIIIDTVRAGCDPNEMYVSPQGYIPSGTQLQYTINFMNTGNDTAFNIYAMDTLSDFVDPSSLRLVSTTNVMNITKFYDNICHNIVRFDFPNINLLDSSHHNQCTGGVSFTINTKSGLPGGTTIFNQAGIYFDQNPVVMTNTVEDIIGDSSTRVITTHNQPANENIVVFPNPTTKSLTITSGTQITSITISNLLGQTLYSQKYNSQQVQVDVANLPSGVYFVKVNGTEVRKFVKQ